MLQVEELCWLPLTVRRLRFLKSKDRYLAAGQATSTQSQLLICRSIRRTDDESGCDDAQQHVVKTEATFKADGVCTDIEICDDLSTSSTYAAVALTSRQRSDVLLVDIHSDLRSSSMCSMSSFSNNCSGAISCLAYDSYNLSLACGTEDGYVSVVDIRTGKEGRRLDAADPIGVTATKYLHAATLVSTGRSASTALRIWDMRAAGPATVLNYDRQVKNAIGSSQRRSHTTVLNAHPLSEVLISGMSDGRIEIWDLRKSSTPIAMNVHSSEGSESTFILCSLL